MVVEEAALHVQVSALRKVLGAAAIATVSGQGYRFTLPMAKVDMAPAPSNHNLPSQITSFVGREQEIAQIKELLTANRLVTLTGAGGAGKTRLAIEVAGGLVDCFADGVWLVELAALSDPQLVVSTVAQVLGVKEQPAISLIDTLAEYLASKQMLLVLDNAEHLLDACVQFVDPALRRSRRVAMLVTSRERLGLGGELTYRVPSLTVPAADDQPTPQTLPAYEGVRLFIERAKLLRPHFAITTDNAAAVASICRRLDGIPLAIELAAPRLRSMSVEELSQRLDQRFALLTDGSRAALPRHRTLRSLIDWSYDLLNEAEQVLLRRVSVFAGGWTLARAEAICGGDGLEAAAVIELLASLVDKSLVLAEDRDGATRYRMLETVRQYALDRLRESGEQAQWQARHLASFLALAEEVLLQGVAERGWIEHVAREHDNMRAALRWCAMESMAEGLRLSAALSRFWLIRAHHVTEGREWHARLLEAVPKNVAARDRARALHSAANLATEQIDYGAAETLYRQSLTICREINERRGEAYALSGLAGLAVKRAPYNQAEPLIVEVAALARTAGYRTVLAANLDNLGVVLHARGDRDGAFRAFDEALAIARDTDDDFFVCHFLKDIGRAACKDGMLPLAERSLVEGLGIAQALAEGRATAAVMETFGDLALAKHAPERAARIFGASERLREEIVAPIHLNERADYESAIAAARAVLGDDAFERAWAEGRAMSLDDAVRYTREGDG
jgi:non-specific serine/threonine protein kinase